MSVYTPKQLEFLRNKAGYIWWETPDVALELPKRLIAQIMNIGTTPDTGELESLFSKQELADVIKTAEAGQFNRKSWSFWHYRLGLIGPSDSVPKMPVRRCFEADFAP